MRWTTTLLFCVAAAVTLASEAQAAASGRILGGTEAAEGQFPHHAGIRTFENEHLCSGWIHSDRWIVTVAHCTTGRTIANTVVSVRTVTLSGEGSVYTLASIVNHPNFNINTMANNLALLQTADEIYFDLLVQPIPLPTSHTPGGVTGTAAGWGATEVSPTVSTHFK